MSAQQDPVPPDAAPRGQGQWAAAAPTASPAPTPSPARGARPPASAGGWRGAWARFSPRRRSAAVPQPAGRRVFRLPGPVVLWWVWLVFAVANLIDLAFTGRDWYSVLVIAILAVITGLMYALALRPRVITDEDGITVQNPLRDHRVPWGGVSSVVVGESVQVRCSRGPDSGREKTVHCWALYAPRRARLRSTFPGARPARFASPTPPSYAKLPKEAKELLKQSPADQIAAELDLQARLARERGAPAGERVGSWPWLAFAALLIPVAALVIVLLAH